MSALSEEEWDALSPHDKRALITIGRIAPVGFEQLQKFVGVGPHTIASLLEKGLIDQGKSVPRNEPGYGLTDKGWDARDRCRGRRPPPSSTGTKLKPGLEPGG